MISPDDERIADVCVDCKETHAAYMVQSAMWKEARLGEEGCCFDCLRERLGRDLIASDLDFYSPCNLFLPMMPNSVLRKLIRLQFQTSEHRRRNIFRSVCRMRREHPQGITMPDFVAWMKTIGVNVTEEDLETARKSRSKAQPQ